MRTNRRWPHVVGLMLLASAFNAGVLIQTGKPFVPLRQEIEVSLSTALAALHLWPITLIPMFVMIGAFWSARSEADRLPRSAAILCTYLTISACWVLTAWLADELLRSMP